MQRRPAASLFIYRPAGCNPGDESPPLPASAKRLAKSCPLNGTAPFHRDRLRRVLAGVSCPSRRHLCSSKLYCQKGAVTDVASV